MPAQVAIVHGWSDSSNSFHDLRAFLEQNGYQSTQIWLADYISMDDDVRIEDAAKRMHQVITDLIGNGKLTVPFDLIVHSTGGLLAREWIVSHFPDGSGCPVKRLLMLAPANFGSRLASLGKSMIGRVAKGWNNWLQTGTEMLRALELASPYQWQLARRDLLDPAGTNAGPYGRGKVWPFVIIGSRGYATGMQQVVNEDGSDGTMRAAAANMNAYGMTIDFSRGTDDPTFTPWASRAADIQFPLAVLPDRDHGTIVHPKAATGSVEAASAALGQLILEALSCDSDDQYQRIYDSWFQRSEQTAQLGRDDKEAAARKHALFTANEPSASALHQFFQVIANVRDDEGRPIDDYFLEFYAPDLAGYTDTVHFQQSVLKDVHVNGSTRGMRCLFIDRNTLISIYYGGIRDETKRQLAVSLSAADVGKNVKYFDATRTGAKGHVTIHEDNMDSGQTLGGARLHRNATHLVEIIIPRRPIDRVFALSQ